MVASVQHGLARGWCFLVLLPTSNAAYEALIMVLVPQPHASSDRRKHGLRPSLRLNKHFVNVLLKLNGF